MFVLLVICFYTSRLSLTFSPYFGENSPFQVTFMADLQAYKQGRTHTHTHTNLQGEIIFFPVKKNFDIKPQVIHGANQSAAIFRLLAKTLALRSPLLDSA
uniref:Secreted protein n=1 Tax=Rhipicephalus appendiculatus TaxID=34631 RepID=A0A131Y9Y9_RHIAP